MSLDETTARGLRVRVQRAFDEFRLDVRFVAPGRGVTALYGPSGAGKTSVLRALAGLDRHVAGELHVGDACWQGPGHFLPAEQRGVGYVFQETSLFEHLNVAQNIDYGLKRAQSKDPARRDALIRLLALEPLLNRDVRTLSGGERRRVAITRALAPAPRLLLLDEPLSGLDRARKAELLPFLEDLVHSLDLPVILVSHDLDEVARLADHLVLMADGQVTGAGPLQETLARLDLPLAQADDASAVLEGVVAFLDHASGLAEILVGDTRLLVPAGALQADQPVRLRIAARDVSVALDPPSRSSILNVLAATIRQRVDRPPLTQLELALADGTRLLARITGKSADLLALETGVAVYAQVKSVAVLP
ncbi:MAG: molybdenum ABC transporter ATP-binding protein [Xanthomonadales bacterium]|jgi:molybdate transport system ATP-binding protein|nr:molybdenum ABC transporter ATP-binding protein [Xanthomonadales bacterium]